MAKILIRNFDRRILFFTYDDSVPDLDPVIFEHYGHAPNDHSLISTQRPPGNLRLGAYLNATLTSADPAPAPTESHGMGLQRRKDFTAWLDGEIAKLAGSAVLTIPEETRQRWTRYLRMLAMVSLRREPFEDDAQWAFVGAARDASPFDFTTLDTAEASVWAAVQREGGLYFVAWWNYATKVVARSKQDFTNPLLNPLGPNYDWRRASDVTLIPEGEIDRTDGTVPGPNQPWLPGSRSQTVARINAKMPWYSS